MRQGITQPAVNKFTLTYDKQTNVCLVRHGRSAIEPTIFELKSQTCAEYFEEHQTQYEQGRRQSRGPPFHKKKRKSVDFVVDNNGLILTGHQGTSGFSTFTSEEMMSRKLRNINPQRLWQINKDTPFPSEMSVHHNQETGHVTIKPTNINRVSLDTFLKMLNCIHWVKVHP